MTGHAEVASRATDAFVVVPPGQLTEPAGADVEWGKEVCDMAIQLHGAPGYLRDLPIEYLYRLIRGGSIAGGTTQIHRNTVAASVLGIRNSQWKS